MKAIKKFSLLSFGEEAEDDEEDLEQVENQNRRCRIIDNKKILKRFGR